MRSFAGKKRVDSVAVAHAKGPSKKHKPSGKSPSLPQMVSVTNSDEGASMTPVSTLTLITHYTIDFPSHNVHPTSITSTGRTRYRLYYTRGNGCIQINLLDFIYKRGSFSVS